MPDPVPHISVVIVSYKVKDLLLDCLATLYRTTSQKVAMEVLVVDNASKDGSVEAIREKFPQVLLLANENNAGFPAANNQAFRLAKGKYVFMLNPDTAFSDDAVGLLYQYMEDHRECSLIAPALLNSDGSHQPSVWRHPRFRYLFSETFYLPFWLGEKNYQDKDLSVSIEAECFSGAAILFRREVLDQIGYLDETMFWIEDTEFCFRAFHAGLTLIYYPVAKVTHHSGQSAKKNYNISISNQIYNKIKFYRKHHNRFEQNAVVLLSLIHVIYKIVVFGFLSPVNKTYFRKAKAYCYTLPGIFNPPIGVQR
jgi:N-acetylglucosaminyl-diphospho-decaprenol L-rhamnosyltransferase